MKITSFAALAVPALLAVLVSGALLPAQAPARAATGGLPVPRTVAQAYARGTRSPDGRPGPRYWQNRARYTIDVTVAPPARGVRGTERIVYTNASPDTLRTLVLKLFLNIHKPGVPRNSGVGEGYLTSGVHIDAFSVNGTAVRWLDDPNTVTWRRVALPRPLLPNDSTTLAIDWHFELSRESNREGMLDSTTAYLAYFYPRVAVYDDTNGWDTMDFTDVQEFYSDFNDYDVTLRVPPHFVVWGTGTLANAAEVLQPASLRRYQASLTSDTVIHVATRADLEAKRVTAPPTAGATNAWRFTARNIPDVAFNVSDHYVWDAASVVVDDRARRRASVQSAYVDTAPDFPYMVRFGRHALDWFSHHWPGVPYPYEKTTIVQGFADMEYPMMVNDSSNPDTTFSKFVVEHEIAHTWFPFYMGIDETRYGFMDEGWATTFEYLIGQQDVGPQRAAEFFKRFRVEQWIRDPSPLQDLPIITPGDVLRGVAYGNNAYGKAALGYLAAKDLLGDATFRKALLAYIDRWHGKHPIPWDFFNAMNDASGQNLNWFWDAWFFRSAYIDVGVTAVRKTADGYAVGLENVGGMPAPVDLVLTYADGTTERLHQPPSIWAANLEGTTVAVPTRKTLTAVALDGGIWMDADAANDRWKSP